MSLTVVGSVAFDALETPFGKRDRVLGGAAAATVQAVALVSARAVASVSASQSRWEQSGR